jgi:hypothetical protein
MAKISVGFAIAAVASTALLMSAGVQSARAEDEPCRADWAKYCHQYNDMEGAVKCLTEHKAQLVPACKKMFGG